MSTACVIYDSIYGNTARVAQAIADRFNQLGLQAELAAVYQIKKESLSEAGLLVIGSPTRGYLATPSIREFLAGLSPSSPGQGVAVFDTRLELAALSPSQKWAVDVGGYASAHMAHQLSERKFTVLAENCFFVEGYEGPLKRGELERAEQWASHLVELAQGSLAARTNPAVE